jgi:hypothetical protein
MLSLYRFLELAGKRPGGQTEVCMNTPAGRFVELSHIISNINPPMRYSTFFVMLFLCSANKDDKTNLSSNFTQQPVWLRLTPVYPNQE